MAVVEKETFDASHALKLERLKQRYQLASVILGTGLVSVIGSWLAFSEKTQENEIVFDQGHRDYVADFVDLALEDDIERRLRFASYFARVTFDENQRALWADYEIYLTDLRAGNQQRLAEIEAASAAASEEDLRRLQSESEFLRRQLEGGTITPAILDQSGERCKQENDTLPAQWLCIARLEVGQQEVSGDGWNSRILGYARSVDLDYSDDDIPWQGLFVAWVITQTDSDMPLPNSPLGSRNWLEFGEPSETPGPGDVLVFWRGSKEGWQGHVGFYEGEDETNFFVLGGNQSNSVNVTRVNKSRLLGARTAG